VNIGRCFLVFTNKRDLTSDYIVRELRRKGLVVHRLNTEDASSLSLTQRVGHSTILNFDGARIELDEVQAAYFRRPMPPIVLQEGISQSSASYVREEWSYLLRSLYLELGDRWFCHPNCIVLAEDKPRQLRLAREVGFAIPETVITNELEPLENLFAGGPVVAKPLRHALLEEEYDLGSVIYTTTIASLSEVDAESLSIVPVIFQRRIEKLFDIRATVVGSKVFSVAIKSQEFEKTKTDWRHSSVVDLAHEVFQLPIAVADQCVELVRRLNLRFGAIDLLIDEAGAIWFLECNPNGQWAWIENRTGLPISAAIVTEMESFSK
jgi:glutathione synthase/RimK-type ligase-like ATP-grasp enzyme